MTEPENDMQNVTITVVVQVNTAGEQHVDMAFPPFLRAYVQSYP